MKVTLADGRTFVGVVEDADVGSDLATVRIQASGLPTMKVSSLCCLSGVFSFRSYICVENLFNSTPSSPISTDP